MSETTSYTDLGLMIPAPLLDRGVRVHSYDQISLSSGGGTVCVVSLECVGTFTSGEGSTWPKAMEQACQEMERRLMLGYL